MACGRKVRQTWSFRGSKSRNKVSVGEPAEGSLTKREVPGPPVPRTRAGAPRGPPAPLTQRRRTPVALVARLPGDPPLPRGATPSRSAPARLSRARNDPNKTFNNGSLGSGIDEERSKMR